MSAASPSAEQDHQELDMTARSSISADEHEAAIEHLRGSFSFTHDIAASFASFTHTTQLEDENSKISLAWRDLQVCVGEKVLLDGCSGIISEGLVAIMGPSGSGKTTLLNCLSCRMDPNMRVSKGELRINGEPYTTSKLKMYLGYVMQDDVLSPQLTVRETLEYVADLRLLSIPKAEKVARVNRILERMSLMHCADQVIGQGFSALSGGERKRISVAVELITEPKMLFLDEPTSNLDSFDALQFVTALRNLVRHTKCVIVCTIHQPQFKVFRLFERLIMLRNGVIVYDNPIENVEDYCERLGSPCPRDVNPADHMMALISPDFNDSFRTEERKKGTLIAARGVTEPVNIGDGANRKVTYLRGIAPFSVQLTVAFRRNWAILMRRQREWNINILINIINMVLVGTVWLQIGTGAKSGTKRIPSLFFTVVNQAVFGAISSVNVFPSDRLIVLRERATGNYNALPYYMSKVAAEMLWKLPFPMVFSLVYFLIGYQNDAERFFRYFITVVMSFMTGMALAMMVSCISRVGHIASLMLPLVMELCRLFSGYFAPPNKLPPGLKWILKFSYLYYGWFAVAHNEYHDLKIVCANNATQHCSAAPELEARGMGVLLFDNALGGLAVYWFVCHVVGYLAFRFLKW